MTQKLNAFLSLDDTDTICVWHEGGIGYDAAIDFGDLVRHSFSDMPPKLAIEWAAKLEMFAHMLRDYAENGQPAVCFPAAGMEEA